MGNVSVNAPYGGNYSSLRAIEVDVLGPQGISQRVLEVIGQVYATEQYPPGLEPMALHFECGEGTGKRNENHLESRRLRPLNSF